MFNTINFRMGVHATIPFYVDMVRNKSIDVNGTGMVISVDGLTPLQLAIAMAIRTGLVIIARDGVETNHGVNLERIIDQMIISANNDIPVSYRVSADIVERIGMIIQASEADTNSVINYARDSLIRDNLVLESHGHTMVQPSIQLEECDNDLVIRVADGIEIGPIARSMEELRSTMEFDLNKKIAHIKDWDPNLLAGVDEWTIGKRLDVPFEMALDVGILEDDDGKIDLVLYAKDNVGTIITYPIKIGTIDPKKLSALDSYFIPDATTESN